MMRHLKIFVNEVLFKDEQLHQNTNTRYFPKKSDLRSHMFQAAVKYRLSKINRMTVQMQVNDYLNAHKKDSFFFRPHIEQDENEMKDSNASSPCNEEEDDNHVDEEVLLTDESGEQSKKLLFLHQTAWQKRLLHRYGDNICLLDATYKTTRYALPLFFLAVKTNVDYQAVAAFMTEDETVSSIKEALELIHTWNTAWTPRFFMTA